MHELKMWNKFSSSNLWHSPGSTLFHSLLLSTPLAKIRTSLMSWPFEWYKTTELLKKKHQFFYCFNTNSISSIWRYWKHVRYTFKTDCLIFPIISSSLSPLSSPSPLPAMLTTSPLTPHRNTRHRNTKHRNTPHPPTRPQSTRPQLTPHQHTPRNTNMWVAWTTVGRSKWINFTSKFLARPALQLRLWR